MKSASLITLVLFFTDVILPLFSHERQLINSHIYYSLHSNINYTFEYKVLDKLLFLGLLTNKTNENISTSVFCKPTSSGFGMNYFSYGDKLFKVNTVRTLINQALKLSYLSLHKKFEFVRNFFYKNWISLKRVFFEYLRKILLLFSWYFFEGFILIFILIF